jgi:hypothetical protein
MVHLSDIHFGQEDKDGTFHHQEDVRDAVKRDCGVMRAKWRGAYSVAVDHGGIAADRTGVRSGSVSVGTAENLIGPDLIAEGEEGEGGTVPEKSMRSARWLLGYFSICGVVM